MPDAVREENAELAGMLDRIAELLEAQRANPFRVHAYRRAADTVRNHHAPVVDVFTRGGVESLKRLPGIGSSLSSLIREYARSGRISVLERLEGVAQAEDVIASVPGIGPVLAHRIHHDLHVDTLEELEVACHDGRLAALEGIGERRLAMITATVGAMLTEAGRRRVHEPEPDQPSVEAILDVDAEYRKRAEAGTLARIAPRRFNPEGRAWLPILHTDREGWSLTALFSNTARAHRLGKTDDWVVVYGDRDGRHDQWTVVSERRGGKWVRVVRGREMECGELARRRAAQRAAVSSPAGSMRTDSTTAWTG